VAVAVVEGGRVDVRGGGGGHAVGGRGRLGRVVVGEVTEGGWGRARAGVASVSGMGVMARDGGWVGGVRDGLVRGGDGLIQRVIARLVDGIPLDGVLRNDTIGCERALA